MAHGLLGAFCWNPSKETNPADRNLSTEPECAKRGASAQTADAPPLIPKRNSYYFYLENQKSA